MSRSIFPTVAFFFLLSFTRTAWAQIGGASDTTLANAYFTKAEILTRGAQYDSANSYLQISSAIYEKAAVETGERTLWEKYVTCYSKVADNLLIMDQSNDALSFLNKALEVGMKVLGENNPVMAKCYDVYGHFHDDQLEFEEARKYFDKSLAIRLQSFGENHLDVAKSYNFVGNVYVDLGYSEKASNYLNKALAIRLKVLDENHLEIANNYQSFFNLHWRIGDLDESLKYLEKSLGIKIRLLGEYHPQLAGVNNNIGLTYYLKGNYHKALEYIQKTLEINRLAWGEHHRNIAATYVNLAACYQELGNYDKALEYLNKALPIHKRSFGENHPVIANKYQYIGEVYLHKGDYPIALDFFNKALDLHLRQPNKIALQIASLYYSIGEAYFKQHVFDQALEYYQKSIIHFVPDFSDNDIYHNPTLQRTFSESSLLSTLISKARAFEGLYWHKSHRLKDIVMSLSTYQAASDLLQLMRNSYKESGSKFFLAEKAVKIYESAIQAALQAYKMTQKAQYRIQAFYFAEKSKTAVLSQSLQESRAKQFSGIPENLLEKEKDLRIDLAFYETELEKEKQKTKNQNVSRIRDYESKCFSLKRDYENLLARFEKSYPQYYELKYKTQTVSVAELQKSLDEQTALLEFFVGDSAIFSFTITKDGFEVVALPKDSSFNRIVASLANSLKNVTSKADYLQGTTRLYQILIKPLEFQISNKRRWIIIPEGDLYQIPFEALLSENVKDDADYRTLPYLIEQHEISYHYSATLWLNSKRESSAGRPSKTFAGFAPVFSKDVKNGSLLTEELTAFSVARPDASTYLITRDGKTLDELPNSEQELREILKTFLYQGRAYLHQDASEENFKKNLKGYKYVHVATHGFINSENPKLSNLAFSQPQDRSVAEDGILYSAETYNLDLDADLLVLSACQTGAGKIAKGEGLIALTRGFLYSGARNIVASLWKVYDAHTSQLMVEMYRQIAAGKTYSAALREAKLKMIANEETAGPQSWAGFVLIGR